MDLSLAGGGAIVVDGKFWTSYQLLKNTTICRTSLLRQVLELFTAQRVLFEHSSLLKYVLNTSIVMLDLVNGNVQFIADILEYLVIVVRSGSVFTI